MSDTSNIPVTQPAGGSSPQADSVKLVYLLYFAGFFVPLTAAAGVIVAYLKRDTADAVTATHFQFQIRTFWIGLLMLIIGGLLWLVVIGWLIWLWWMVWTLVRCIKGFMLMSENKSVPDPMTWLW